MRRARSCCARPGDRVVGLTATLALRHQQGFRIGGCTRQNRDACLTQRGLSFPRKRRSPLCIAFCPGPRSTRVSGSSQCPPTFPGFLSVRRGRTLEWSAVVRRGLVSRIVAGHPVSHHAQRSRCPSRAPFVFATWCVGHRRRMISRRRMTTIVSSRLRSRMRARLQFPRFVAQVARV